MSESGKPVDLDKGRPLAKTAKSGWGVIFSTLFGGLFLILCVACGIGLYSFRPVIDASPEAAVKAQQAALDIQVPMIFSPKGTIDWNVAFLLQMHGAYYEHSRADGEIVLLHADSRFFSSPELRDHVRKTLLDKGGTGVPLKRDDVSFREYMIQNQPVKFRFEKGRSPTNDKPYYVVDGVVPGKTGEVLIGIRLEADAWDESQMMGMLESIK